MKFTRSEMETAAINRKEDTKRKGGPRMNSTDVLSMTDKEFAAWVRELDRSIERLRECRQQEGNKARKRPLPGIVRALRLEANA